MPKKKFTVRGPAAQAEQPTEVWLEPQPNGNIHMYASRGGQSHCILWLDGVTGQWVAPMCLPESLGFALTLNGEVKVR